MLTGKHRRTKLAAVLAVLSIFFFLAPWAAHAGSVVTSVVKSRGIDDHGRLEGLADDDHPQYFETDGSDAMTGNLNLGTYSLVGNGGTSGLTVALNGDIDIGTATGAGALNLPDSGTTAASGMTFGSDVNLYRGTADQLKTDDGISVGGSSTLATTWVTSLYGRTSGATFPIGSRKTGGAYAVNLTLDPDTLRVGVGAATTPDATLHVELNSVATNIPVEVTWTTLASTGAPAIGLAARHVWELETAAGNNEVGAFVQARITDATAASEDFALGWGLMRDGAAAVELMSLDSAGIFSATSVKSSPVGAPALDFHDIDCTDGDISAAIEVNATATGTGAEVVDVSIKAQGAATAGTLGEFIGWDGSAKLLSLAGALKVSSQSVTCASNVCAYSAVHHSSYYTTEANAAADVLTVADGVAGQRRTFVLKTDGGDDLEVTPTNFANGAKVTLDAAGESVTLEFDGTDWFVVSTYGGTVS